MFSYRFSKIRETEPNGTEKDILPRGDWGALTWVFMAGIMFAMKKVLQMGSNRCHPSVIKKRLNAVILGQSAPIFCYPKHFLSIFRLRVHPLFSKTIQCSMPRGKLIQSSNKESCSDIVQLIVGQWTPIPLPPPYNFWLFCKESFCCLRGEVVFSWKYTRVWGGCSWIH